MMHRAVAPLLPLVRSGRSPWRALVVLCVAWALAVGGRASGSPLGAFTTFKHVAGGGGPNGIALGPDGNMWFAESAGNRIGRIDRAGAVTEFPVPTPASAPWEIAAGVDGSMWFTEWETSRIARVTGRRSVGARLTCARTNRSPWAVASTSYTWMRGGTAIRGATRRTYTVAPRDSGRRISCRAAVTLRPALTRFGAQSRAVPIR